MDIQKHYESVQKFNSVAGNLDNVTVEKIKAQMKVFIEEAKETEDAFENKDAVELLDGICDSFVTLVGLMQMAEKAGFKVDEALKRVNENNLSKYTLVFPNVPAGEYTVQFNTEFGVHVIKDQNGKIRKPVGFVPVVIDDLAPKDFFGGAA